MADNACEVDGSRSGGTLGARRLLLLLLLLLEDERDGDEPGAPARGRGDAGEEVGDERGDADVAGALLREVGHDGFLEMNAMMTEMNAETMATGSVYTVMSMPMPMLLLLREARWRSRMVMHITSTRSQRLGQSSWSFLRYAVRSWSGVLI